MASIDTYLQKILEAVYGEEVRGSIHDAIAAMNEESTRAEAAAISAQNSATAKAAEATEQARIATEQQEEATRQAEEATRQAEEATRQADIAIENAAEATAQQEEATRQAEEATAQQEEATRQANIAIAKAGEASESETNAATSEGNALYYMHQAEEFASEFSGGLKPRGTIYFEDLPDISDASVGWEYNIIDSFDTDNRFRREGVHYNPGANVYLTDEGKWDVLITGSRETACFETIAEMEAAREGLAEDTLCFVMETH